MSDAKIACLCGMGKGQAAYRLGLFLPPSESKQP